MRSFNCSFPHTAHCLASGEIMISTMGDKEENGKGDFVLIDSKSLKVTGKCGHKRDVTQSKANVFVHVWHNCDEKQSYLRTLILF